MKSLPLFAVGLLLLGAAPAFAQHPKAVALPPPAATETTPPVCKTVNGQVLDANGKPLLGALIAVVGTRDLNSTNSEGYYNFAVPNFDQLKLRFSAAGYTDQELDVTQCTMPPVTLQLLPGTRIKQGKKHYGKIVKVNDKRVK